MIINTLEKIKRAKSELMQISLIYAGTAMLTFCAAYCTLGVLISGFDFTVDMGGLLLIVLLGAFTVTAAAMIFRKWGIFALFVPVFVLIIINRELVAGELEWFICNLTERYSEWIPIPVLFPENAADTSEHILFFSITGIAIVFLLAFAICLRRSTALTLLSTLPFVLLSFVLVDTQANGIYLAGLIAVYLTILVSNAFYLDDFNKSALAFIPTFALIAAMTGSVYLAVPPERYERSARAELLRAYLYDIAEEASRLMTYLQENDETGILTGGWFGISDTGMWSFNTNKAEIAEAGPRVITNQQLLEIQTSQPGIFYLRGFSLDYFDGRAWNVWRDKDNEFEKAALERPAMLASAYLDLPPAYLDRYFEETAAAKPPDPSVAGMNIRRLEDITNVSYIPYYSGGSYIDSGDFNDLSDYEMRFYHIPGSVRAYALDEIASPGLISDIEYDFYTQIDGGTAEGLRQLAIDAGIDITAPREEVVDAVAEYIRSSGRYTLTPPVTPKDEDFALYFLRTSRQGYCIHFATAAALMLRALDIPARFASGYVALVPMLSTTRPVVITDENAHTWVEVLYEDAGWLTLEVTPSSGNSSIPTVARPHTPAEQTPPPTEEPPAPPQIPSTPRPAPSGQGGAQGTGARTPMPAWLINYIVLFLILAVIILALIMRRRVLLSVRNRRFTQKNTNAVVISLWEYAAQISRGEATIPTDIEELALKARFSQHRITQEEMAYMKTYTDRLASEIYESKGEFSRLWFKYIRGLW